MSESSSAKILVAMPAYNEEGHVGSMVLQARQYADEVLVLDDGSQDQTAKVAKLAGATVVSHQTNMGYGSTIQDIFIEAKKRDTDILVILDADCQHNPDEIPSMVDAISRDFDVVVSSREMK